ncbi:MAG: CBS domain-containing protein [FCB group bacterium]|nr:CBS domain-containing protein [FCB group bacterium]
MLVKELLQAKPSPVTISADRTLQEAMRLLIEHKIGSLVIVNIEDNPVGIITERDIFHLALRYQGDMMDMRVGDNMTTRMMSGIPEDDINQIARVMIEKGIRHIPIIDSNRKLCGILSMRDIVKAKMESIVPG